MSTLEVDRLRAWGVEHGLEDQILLEATSAGGETEIEFETTALDHSLLFLDWRDVAVDTDGAVLGLQFKKVSWLTTNYEWAMRTHSTNARTLTIGDQVETFIPLVNHTDGIGNHAVEQKSRGSVMLQSWNRTRYQHAHIDHSVCEAPTSVGAQEISHVTVGGGIHTANGPLTGFRFMLSGAATFAAGGKFRLRGLREFEP